jgi:hypothetical protein
MMTRTFKLGASKPHEAPVHEGAQIFMDVGEYFRRLLGKALS